MKSVGFWAQEEHQLKTLGPIFSNDHIGLVYPNLLIVSSKFLGSFIWQLLPAVCIFAMISCVPWEYNVCQHTLPVMSQLVSSLGMCTVLHLLWMCAYQCMHRAILRHFSSLDISPLHMLSKHSLQMLFSCSWYPSHSSIGFFFSLWALLSLIVCFSWLFSLLVSCHSSSWDMVESVSAMDIWFYTLSSPPHYMLLLTYSLNLKKFSVSFSSLPFM